MLMHYYQVRTSEDGRAWTWAGDIAERGLAIALAKMIRHDLETHSAVTEMTEDGDGNLSEKEIFRV